MYPLSEVLLLLTCATIASCDDFDDIVAWGEHHLEVLRRFAPFHFGIPCERWLRDAGQPGRSGAVRALLRGLDQGAVAGPARFDRHRRQDVAAHARQGQGVEGASYAERLCDQCPAHPGATQRAGKDQRNHRHPGAARSPRRDQAARRRAGHHRRHGLPGRDRRQDRRPQGRLSARPEGQPADLGNRGRSDYFGTAPGTRDRPQNHGRKGPWPDRNPHLHRLHGRRLDQLRTTATRANRASTTIKTIVKVEHPNRTRRPLHLRDPHLYLVRAAAISNALPTALAATGASRACTGCSTSSSRTI